MKCVLYNHHLMEDQYMNLLCESFRRIMKKFQRGILKIWEFWSKCAWTLKLKKGLQSIIYLNIRFWKKWPENFSLMMSLSVNSLIQFYIIITYLLKQPNYLKSQENKKSKSKNQKTNIKIIMIWSQKLLGELDFYQI